MKAKPYLIRGPNLKKPKTKLKKYNFEISNIVFFYVYLLFEKKMILIAT
jgi:hypothetical protein